eukprot:CAMPEP_0197848588 /NCGR_PEP_ID=MMETSP1438-20131217/9207_1 /TAXON_ID=1461541 /ORGANISM="Pterosperma sp., Strain CCMP1384" /LENGTH=415 /DNA_ID=CAMNT_0043460911 /DNA_START=50 /DNA_END=1297 /DNA_ORIENTATION=+
MDDKHSLVLPKLVQETPEKEFDQELFARECHDQNPLVHAAYTNIGALPHQGAKPRRHSIPHIDLTPMHTRHRYLDLPTIVSAKDDSYAAVRHRALQVVGLTCKNMKAHKHHELPPLRSEEVGIDELAFGRCKNIFEAASKGRCDEIKRLLAPTEEHHRIGERPSSRDGLTVNHTDLDPQSSTYGQTPLMVAVNLGDERMVRELLRHGADVAVIEKGTNRTAIHMAARKGHDRILADLIDTLPSVSIAKELRRIDCYGFCALFLSQIGRRTSVGLKRIGFEKATKLLETFGQVKVQEEEPKYTMHDLAAVMLAVVWGERLRSRTSTIHHCTTCTSEVVSPQSSGRPTANWGNNDMEFFVRHEVLRQIEREYMIQKGREIRQQMKAKGEWSKVVIAARLMPMRPKMSMMDQLPPMVY